MASLKDIAGNKKGSLLGAFLEVVTIYYRIRLPTDATNPTPPTRIIRPTTTLIDLFKLFIGTSYNLYITTMIIYLRFKVNIF